MTKENETPWSGKFEHECPHCGSDNVSDVTPLGDEHSSNLCLDCDAEYAYTGRKDIETRTEPTY